jgi:hypothetical protein
MTRWYVGGMVAAIAVGWIAALCHSYGIAPVGIISIVIGLLLGTALSTLAAIQRIAGARKLVIGTTLLALLTVVAQHAWLYHDFRRQWHDERAKSPQVAMFRPEEPWSPQEFFAHEATPKRVTLWLVDAALIIGTAVTVVLIRQRTSSPLPTPDS